MSLHVVFLSLLPSLLEKVRLEFGGEVLVQRMFLQQVLDFLHCLFGLMVGLPNHLEPQLFPFLQLLYVKEEIIDIFHFFIVYFIVGHRTVPLNHFLV